MDKEIERIIEELSKYEPTSMIYRELLYTLETATRVRDGLTFGQRSGSIFHPIDPTDTPAPKPTKKKAKKEEPVKEPDPVVEPEPVVEPTPVAEPVPAPVVEEPQVECTKEYTRAKIDEAKSKGVLIREIVLKYVPEGQPQKFGGVPASSYPDLVRDLEEAINNAG